MQIDGLKQRSFVVRYLTLFGGEGLSKICVFVAFAYLARMLGPRAFGLVELSLAVTGFFVLGTECGLGSYGARLIERSPSLAPSLIPQVAVLRIILGVPAYLGLLCVSARFGMPGFGVLAVYGLLVLMTPFSTQWVFQGLRQMQWVAAASFLRYAVFLAGVLLLVRKGSDIMLVALAEVCGAAAVALFNAVIGRWALRIQLDWHGAFRGALGLFKQAWFLGASELAWAVIWFSPGVMTWWVLGGRMQEVAWLAAAVRVVMALHTFVWLYFFNILPNLSKEIHGGLEGWRDLVERSVAGSTWAACFVALLGTVLAPVIVETAFGGSFRAAILPLQIAVWMIPIAWFSGHFRFSLIAAGHQRLECAASAGAGVVTIVVAYFGIRIAAAPGAAVALLAGGAVNAALAWLAASRAIGPMRLSTAAAPILSCLGAAAVGLVGARLFGPATGAVAAMLVYGLRAANRENVERLKLAWRGRL